MHQPKQSFPKEWVNRKSVSASEYNNWLNGKSKNQKLPKIRINPIQDFATYKDGILTVVIHELPTTYNDRKHWPKYIEREEKRRWEQIMWGIILEAGRPVFKNPVVRVDFYFPDNRPRDPQDNYMSWKALTDGLTRAGVITDDCWQKTKVEAPGTFIDRENARTEIIITEAIQ
jgi:hypothetical protein